MSGICTKSVSSCSMSAIERFVVLLYDHTSTCSDVHLARERKIPRRNTSNMGSLEQHVKRCTYEGGYSWGQTLEPSCTLPSPCDWGWVENEGQFEPLWTTLQEATKSCPKSCMLLQVQNWLYRTEQVQEGSTEMH